MATGRFDVLPTKDMSRVKKQIRDIRKKLRGRSHAKASSSLKLIPKKDVKEVKKGIKAIKETLTKAAASKRVNAKITRFDNYYDLTPHKRIKKLEEQVRALKEMLRTRNRKEVRAKKRAQTGEARGLERSMNKLSNSINNLMRLFERASKDSGVKPDIETTQVSGDVKSLAVGSDTTQNLAEIKDRLAELSMENEQMAKGILVAVELLKEGIPVREEEEKESQNPFEKSFAKKEEFSSNIFDQGKESDLPQMPPLDDMPEAPTPGTQFSQDKRRSMF